MWHRCRSLPGALPWYCPLAARPRHGGLPLRWLQEVWCPVSVDGQSQVADQVAYLQSGNGLRHHLSSSPAVMMWKVVGQYLFLNILPRSFTLGSDGNLGVIGA